jgi:hypothetical protein
MPPAPPAQMQPAAGSWNQMPRWMMIGGGLLIVVLCFGALAVGGIFLLSDKNEAAVPAANQEVAGLQATISAQEAAIAAQTMQQAQPTQQPTPQPQATPIAQETALPEAVNAEDQATASAPGVKVWFDTSTVQDFRIMSWEELWDEKPFDSGMVILEFKNPDGMVTILPLIEYADWLDDSKVFSDLTWAISNGDEEDLEVCIPIPLTPCDEQAFNLQVETLNFKNGNGIRSASAQIVNDVIAINNESMDYSFYGLTTDQRFYIIGNFELDHENLPENDWVFKLDDADIDIDAFDEIFANVYDELSRPNGYSPSLTSIDAVIKSLRVEAE